MSLPCLSCGHALNPFGTCSICSGSRQNYTHTSPLSIPIIIPTPPTLKSDFTTTQRAALERKNTPLFSGVMMYFPKALQAIAQHSQKGNTKHNPGQPLHWAKEKSTDHADCVARHLLDIGPKWDGIDEETGSYHAVALAWRALALLETLLEKKEKKE